MTTINGLWGAFLGLLLLLLWPVAFVAVALYAIRGRYPFALTTPDDPFERELAPHFGHYEETVRAIYTLFGRYVGDVYWLGLRNSLYGLRYMLKPNKYRGLIDYSHMRVSVSRGRLMTTYIADGLPLWQINLWTFEILAGWMVRGAATDQHTIRQPVNMEFRPVFSPRRAG